METNSKNKIKDNITGLLLCAGLSRRMGTSKALMAYNGSPFAVLIIKKLLSVCNEVTAVLGYESEKVISGIKNYLNKTENVRVRFVLNENYKDGMFSSLQCGLKSITKTDWVLYHFVDQPTIPISFYSEFVNQLSDQVNWIQPFNSDKLGHPILFNSRVAKYILELTEKNSLRDLINDKRIKRRIWKCSFSEILQDVDTIEQFNRINCNS